MTMRNLMVIFLLFCYARVTSFTGSVTFTSRNFNNTLTWDPAAPRAPGHTVRYSVVYFDTHNEVFHEKAQCQNITELLCDLTAETLAHHDTYYKAQVFADGVYHGTSRKFKPIAETVLGAPTLSFKTSTTSLHMQVMLPVGPYNESIEEIFSKNYKGPSEATTFYTMTITQPLWAVQDITNTTGHFDVSLKGDEREYCGYVVYTPIHELGRPWSEKATFCVELKGKPPMVLPWLLLIVAVVVAVVLMSACFAKRYVRNVKNNKLPTSLVSPMQTPRVILYPQKEPNISKPEISPENEKTVYAKILVKPNVSSPADESYGHKNTIFMPWKEDSSLDTVRCHSPGVHDQDDSAQSSDIYGAVAVELFQTPDRNNTPLMSNGKDLVESGQLLSTIKTLPLSSVDNFDNNEVQPLFLQTRQNSEGQLLLNMLSFQEPQTFTAATEELVPPERKPLLSYLIVSSDKGDNFVSLHSLESSECSDSGLDENTLPTPIQDCSQYLPTDQSQYLPTQPDLTLFSPGSQSPQSCDSGIHDSGYKQNWMPPLIHEPYKTSYPWTWKGLKEECENNG